MPDISTDSMRKGNVLEYVPEGCSPRTLYTGGSAYYTSTEWQGSDTYQHPIDYRLNIHKAAINQYIETSVPPYQIPTQNSTQSSKIVSRSAFCLVVDSNGCGQTLTDCRSKRKRKVRISDSPSIDLFTCPQDTSLSSTDQIAR
jgi:hypothetical protein